MIHFQIVQIK